jgi:hypothetical protein
MLENLETLLPFLPLVVPLLPFCIDMFRLLKETKTFNPIEIVAVVAFFLFYGYIAYAGVITMAGLMERDANFSPLASQLTSSLLFSIGYVLTKDVWKPYKKYKIPPRNQLGIQMYLHYMVYSMMATLFLLITSSIIIYTVFKSTH